MLRPRAERRCGAGVGSQGCGGGRAPPRLEHQSESQRVSPPREPGVPRAHRCPLRQPGAAGSCLPRAPRGCSAVLPFPSRHGPRQSPVGSPGLLRSQPGRGGLESRDKLHKGLQMTHASPCFPPDLCGNGDTAACVFSSRHPREKPAAFGKDPQTLPLPGHPTGSVASGAVPWSCPAAACTAARGLPGSGRL